MKLDEFDIKILATLQESGRMTKLDLAERIGLSASPCWERLRRLEHAGFIRGYHADVAVERLAKTSLVFVEVTLRTHEAQDFMRFERAIQNVPEIVECHATAGGFDYLLKVVTTDIEHYQSLIEDLLGADIGIHRYFTYIVTKSIKRFTGYPIERLIDSERRSQAMEREKPREASPPRHRQLLRPSARK